MHEIKFRAWDMNNMFFIEYINFPIKYIRGSTESGEQCILSKNAILMQYTGLKDKNNKEIYEGDIIRGVWYFHHILYENAVVERDTFVIGEYGIKADTWIVNKKNLQRIPLHSLSDIEVVGNIYENPALLNRKVKQE